ncbi:alpha-crystallin domain-containing protein 22.3-like isoform X1 [Lycium barbarum]|uniref:alpha-crystallin domain-containing protein 22.3-like isoform X1 n=1 Tax=Lycium barbarum TaxID=112863 RepID=UPI00293F1C6D|nr:alpha-crystallin domain-containing protein 22.3-like isoform X1 [Lycium barbarum]XP_060200004.1 alpha-crystallin domain-containing protein 22.3-like isoform X1 [Lycium barbarum]
MRTKRTARCKYPYEYEPDVVQTGAAQEGRAGFPNEPVTLFVTKDSYKYKVVLPVVPRNLYKLSVEVEYNGKFEVEGMVCDDEITSSVVPITLNRNTQRMFPPRHFTIGFYLPGPANPESLTTRLLSDGVLEGELRKPGVAEAP